MNKFTELNREIVVEALKTAGMTLLQAVEQTKVGSNLENDLFNVLESIGLLGNNLLDKKFDEDLSETNPVENLFGANSSEAALVNELVSLIADVEKSL